MKADYSEASHSDESLRAGRSGDRIPVGARYSATVQTGPGAHPTSCAMAVKRPRRGGDQRTPCRAEAKELVELYLYSPSGPSWPVLGLTLLFLPSPVKAIISASTNKEAGLFKQLRLKYNGQNTSALLKPDVCPSYRQPL